MPTIEFSSAAMIPQMGFVYSVLNNTYQMAQTSSFWTPLCSGGESGNQRVRLNIYKGTRPTTRPTSMATFSADLLVSYPPSAWNESTGPTTQSFAGTIHTLQIISQFVSATASGTATWFAIANYDTSNNTVYGFVTGAVGTSGSGADLIIADTNIVSGQQYRVSNLTLTQPSVLNY